MTFTAFVLTAVGEGTHSQPSDALREWNHWGQLMGSLSIWHWLIFSAFLIVPLGIYFFFRSRTHASQFLPLKATGTALNVMIIIGVVGKTVLQSQQFREAGEELNPAIFVPLFLIFLAGIYAGVGASIFFFSRALHNINVFANARIHSRWTPLLAVVPVVNMIALPYVWGVSYYRSLALLPAHAVSMFSATCLSVGTFALLLVTIAHHVIERNGILVPAPYDEWSVLIIGTCISLAAGMLATRIISRVHNAQTTYALANGIVEAGPKTTQPIVGGVLDNCRSIAIGLLVITAGCTTLFPSQASYAVQLVRYKILTSTNTVDSDTRFRFRSGISPIGSAPAVSEAPSAAPARPSAEEVLQIVAADLNRTGRTQVDPITWLEKVTTDGNRFNYEYSIVTQKLSPDGVARLLNHVRPGIINGYCREAHMQHFRYLKTSVSYRYWYSDRTFIGEVVVSLTDCK